MSLDLLTDNLPSAATHMGAVVNSVLVVDDDKEAVAAIKALLETQKYTVLTARDGGQAQAQFTMRKPDFVLLDVMLPNDTGFEVCERFKVTDPRVPVLFLTGVDTAAARDLAIRVGADGFLVKPTSPRRLLEEIPAIANRVWAKMHNLAPTPHQHGEYVRFNCPCGRKIKVAASHRGKQLSCPQCGEPVLVPRHD